MRRIRIHEGLEDEARRVWEVVQDPRVFDEPFPALVYCSATGCSGRSWAMEDQINTLIEEARGLKGVRFDSPRVDLFETRAKEFVRENYGRDRAQILDTALFWGHAVSGDYEAQRLHVQAMDQAIELLEALKNETPRHEKPSAWQPPKEVHTRSRPPRSGDTYVIHGGNVAFGDGTTFNNITIKQIVEALHKEVEAKAPEGEKKRTILTALKELATSKEFGEVTGTVIGEIVKKAMGQG